jgi:hypothetical protein
MAEWPIPAEMVSRCQISPWSLAPSVRHTSLSQLTIDAVADELNDRPRRTHGYRSPAQVWAVHLNVALPLLGGGMSGQGLVVFHSV